MLRVSSGFKLCATFLTIEKYSKTVWCGSGSVAVIFSIYLNSVLYLCQCSLIVSAERCPSRLDGTAALVISAALGRASLGPHHVSVKRLVGNKLIPEMHCYWELIPSSKTT